MAEENKMKKRGRIMLEAKIIWEDADEVLSAHHNRCKDCQLDDDIYKYRYIYDRDKDEGKWIDSNGTTIGEADWLKPWSV